MGYRSDLVGATPPTTWADYFDTSKYPGNGGMYNGYYAFTLGTPRRRRADRPAVPRSTWSGRLEKLDTIKDDLVFWETGTQALELLSSGEVVIDRHHREPARGDPRARSPRPGELGERLPVVLRFSGRGQGQPEQGPGDGPDRVRHAQGHQRSAIGLQRRRARNKDAPVNPKAAPRSRDIAPDGAACRARRTHHREVLRGQPSEDQRRMAGPEELND